MQEVGYAILFNLSSIILVWLIDIRSHFVETMMQNESIFSYTVI